MMFVTQVSAEEVHVSTPTPAAADAAIDVNSESSATSASAAAAALAAVRSLLLNYFSIILAGVSVQVRASVAAAKEADNKAAIAAMEVWCRVA
jgi:hypothetical protein